MLQELAARTGAATWVVVSMLFFIGCWIAIAVWLWRARPEDLEAHARLALEGDEASPKESEPGADPRA